MSVFKTAFIQVFLVSINTIFLAKGLIIGVAVATFSISYFWVGNVKKANIATERERFIYSFGAMCGGLTGLLFTKLFT
jgi:hypothetical protein